MSRADFKLQTKAREGMKTLENALESDEESPCELFEM